MNDQRPSKQKTILLRAVQALEEDDRPILAMQVRDIANALPDEPSESQTKINNLIAALNAKQAKIDALMLEFCPGEMSASQREGWAAAQERADEPPFTREEWEQVDKQTVELQNNLRAMCAWAELLAEQVEMGWYVHLHVCFSCNENEPVAKLAEKHLALITGDEGSIPEARWFLESLSKRTGQNPGPKGGLSLWGITGNYTNVDAFVTALGPFWLDMFKEEIGVLDFEHILVFEEREQSEKTIAHEIAYDRDTGQLVTKRHECPFTFMQM